MSQDFVLPDLTNANISTKQVYDPLPPAKYELIVTSAKFKKSKNKGTPSVNCEFQVVSGEYKNRKLWNDFWLTPKAAGMLASFLAIANVRINGKRIHNDNLNDHEAATFLSSIVGCKVIGKVKIEVDPNGQYEPKNKISGFDVHPSNPEPPTSTNAIEVDQPANTTPSAGPDEAPDLSM